MSLVRASRPVTPALPVRLPAGLAADAGPDARGTTEAVEVYCRTYMTLLRSSGATRLRVLEPSHRAMSSSLHPLAAEPEVDLGAFLYACRRVPEEVLASQLVVMGQSGEVFARQGFPLAEWTAVTAPGRRRRWYHDGRSTVAVLIASASDVDDLIPTLVALQIERNKLHERLRQAGLLDEVPEPSAADCAAALGGSEADWEQLCEVWGESFGARLRDASGRRLSLRVRMLGGTQVGYARATRQWWSGITPVLEREALADRPIYFVSSNSHSVANLLSGTAPRREEELVRFVEDDGPAELRDELRRFREGRADGDWHNFLYYAARLYYRGLPPSAPQHAERSAEEHALGIHHIPGRSSIDVAAQVMALDRLHPGRLDPRLGEVDMPALGRSGAVIVNIDYPLGLAGYNILREIAEYVDDLRAVYVLGKAATLNADVGDVMISDVVHDEHSGNTFWLDNAFDVSDIAPHLRFGSGLDHQRAVSVRGTFLQNRGYLDLYHREAFTVVEMEAGPYCCAVYEMSDAGRYPMGEPVNFSKLPVDVGIIHYASGTPYTQARTLGARGLSYHGMDSTYAASVAIVRRVLRLEGALAGGSGRFPNGHGTGRHLQP